MGAGDGVCQQRLRSRRGPRLRGVLRGEGLVPDLQVLVVLLEVVELELQLSCRAPRELQLEAHTLHGLPLLRMLRLCQARQDLHTCSCIISKSLCLCLQLPANLARGGGGCVSRQVEKHLMARHRLQ